jgi:hypothetical protein
VDDDPGIDLGGIDGRFGRSDPGRQVKRRLIFGM